MRPSLQSTTLGYLTIFLPYCCSTAALPQLPIAHPRSYPDPNNQNYLARQESLKEGHSDVDIELLSNAKEQTPSETLSSSSTATRVPVLRLNFPDPSVLQDEDGTWYAFATAGNGKQIQAATAPSSSGPWAYVDRHVLPDPGSWTTGQHTWAPDVSRLGQGRYVMYYSGQQRPTEDTNGSPRSPHYCLGVATASSALGPYIPMEKPWFCAEDKGGIIDPSGFHDPLTGRRYVIYKIDGNSIGHGGSCGNGETPHVPTPIMIVEVDSEDGVTILGDPIQILDRDEADGPLVEAPSLAYLEASDGEGRYVLFYSSHCWFEGSYDINYATANSVDGPYRKSGYNPLMATGDLGLTAPGGATVVEGEGRLVFHANCREGRCMYDAEFWVDGTDVIIREQEG
ncbi:hypothetical protein DL546_006085 [Coniochaeta pulveracea]|uniref:Uncharacterized protein n=1 Tax=Coniochaeta pulveracea TaxID=177199 RepID=A0A420YAX4_9PEZI|nr:hypothetical protein DL546_006085 [Coniochaeta pulveracea]